MTPREIVTVAKGLQHKSAAAVDEELRRRHLDAQDRLAVRIEIQAQAQQRRVTASGLATDDAEYGYQAEPRPLTEIQRLMQRAGLEPGQKYSETDIEEGCRRGGIVDLSEKLAVKIECDSLNMVSRAYASQDLRHMRASAEHPRGKVLVDEHGNPRTLRFS